jgi:hypothetical protein
VNLGKKHAYANSNPDVHRDVGMAPSNDGPTQRKVGGPKRLPTFALEWVAVQDRVMAGKERER